MKSFLLITDSSKMDLKNTASWHRSIRRVDFHFGLESNDTNTDLGHANDGGECSMLDGSLKFVVSKSLPLCGSFASVWGSLSHQLDVVIKASRGCTVCIFYPGEFQTQQVPSILIEHARFAEFIKEWMKRKLIMQKYQSLLCRNACLKKC